MYSQLPKITNTTRFDQRGVSAIELLVVLMLSSILSGIVVSNLKELNDPLQNGTAQLVSFFKEIRVRAIAQTAAYIVTPSSSTQITTLHGATCATATTPDPALILKLPNGASLVDTSWSICFTSRGIVDQNLILGIREGAQHKEIEIMIGGGIRLL